jgi:substrate import-associated zinc metallohydrolase lipoprotein
MNFIPEQDKISNEIDQWIYDTFTVPYNIRIEYRFDRKELPWKSLTPIKIEKVQPFANEMKKYFIDIYEKYTDAYFIKTYLPKQYVFVGSPEYNANSVTTGTAAAGRRVTIFRLNEYNEGDWTFTHRVMKTVHHEFAHILDQNKRLGPSLGALSKANYVDDEWTNYNDAEANAQGFITPYAMSEPNEDFAEMVAMMLINGKDWFDNLMSNIPTVGANILRQKEAIIVDYFENVWKIDFRALQNEYLSRNPEPYIPPSPYDLANDFGLGEKFQQFYYYPTATDVPVSAAFRTAFDAISADFASKYDGRSIYHFLFTYSYTPGALSIRVYYDNGSGGTANNSLRFNVIHLGENRYKFVLYDPTSGSTYNRLSKLKEYMENNTFLLKYADFQQTIGGFHVEGKEDDEFIVGKLSN